MSFTLPRFLYIDNSPSSGGTGDIIATDELATLNGVAVTGVVKVQRQKLGFGSDSTLRDVDAANPLPVVLPSGGFVSIVNSTIVNLGISGVFTGTGEDVTVYASIKISVFASAASAVDGLQIQQSINNTDWDGLDIYSIPAATNRAFSVPVNAKFFRIVYTNGTTATTAFRLQVIYHTSDKQPSSVRPQDGRSNDNDFVEMLGFLMGYNSATNSWNRIGITNAVTGGNENLIDRIKVNAALRMIDNAQPSGSKLVNVTGNQVLGMDVNVGTDITTPTAMPAGGLGVRGWLSSIWTKLNGIVSVASTSSIIPAPTLMQNAAVAIGNGTNLNVQGYASIILNITGTFVGTIIFEASVDDTIFVPITGHQIGVAGSLFTSSTTAGDFRINTAAYKSVRARISVWLSGSITVKGYASPVAGHPTTVNANITSQPELVTTGTITTTDIVVAAPSGTGVLLSGTSTVGSYVAMSASGGNASVVIGITGLTTGTIYYEGSADSTTGIDGNWIALNMKQAGVVNTQISSFATANGLYRGNTAGIRYIRMRSVGTLAGTPSITLRLSAGVAGEFLFGSIPSGTNTIGNINDLRAATLAVTATAALATAVTITLPAVAAQFHYITAIEIVLYSAAARTGSATPNVVTTTNLPGAIAFTFSTAGAIGTTDTQDLIRVTPLKSSVVNTATTIVCPVAAGGIWRITVTYFTAA